MDIYRNLHKSCWSLKIRGLPIEHHDELVVEEVRFSVQPAGNARVRREGRKHVHAFVRSNHQISPTLCKAWGHEGWVKVTYNPYKDTTFVVVNGDNRIPVKGAKYVHLTTDGNCYAYGLRCSPVFFEILHAVFEEAS